MWLALEHMSLVFHSLGPSTDKKPSCR